MQARHWSRLPGSWIVTDLVDSGLDVSSVCGGHGLQGYGVLAAHFHIANLQTERTGRHSIAEHLAAVQSAHAS